MRLMEKVLSTAIYDTTRKKNIDSIETHHERQPVITAETEIVSNKNFSRCGVHDPKETKCPKVVDYSSQRLPLGKTHVHFDDNLYNRDSDPKTRLTTKK